MKRPGRQGQILAAVNDALGEIECVEGLEIEFFDVGLIGLWRERERVTRWLAPAAAT